MKLIHSLILFFLFTLGFSQKYDPKTGKLIQEKQVEQRTGDTIEKVEYDPNTGEIIKKSEETKKSLLNKEVMVILISDDTIRGELIKELDKQITISSSTIGSITVSYTHLTLQTILLV